MIVFNDVSKRFRLRQARSLKQTVMASLRGGNQVDEFTAVNELSFEVFRGEAVALMGKNGSGKIHYAQAALRCASPDRGLGQGSWPYRGPA